MAMMLLVVGLAVVLGLLIAVALASRAEEHDRIVTVEGEPNEVLDDVHVALSRLRGYELSRPDASHLSVHTSSIPGWAIVVSILLFPLGLIALLSRTHQAAVVITSEGPRPGLTTLRLGGRFEGQAVYRINRVIVARSPAPERRPPDLPMPSADPTFDRMSPTASTHRRARSHRADASH
jgi:hypothetical protein